jgi:hypothetical protein
MYFSLVLLLFVVFSKYTYGEFSAGGAGSAILFSGEHSILRRSTFSNFPTNGITSFFWMKSIDTANIASPFSYSTNISTYGYTLEAYLDFFLWIDGKKTDQDGTGVNSGCGGV